MRVIIRGTSGTLRSRISFALSGGVHGFLLAWLMVASAMPRWERPRTLYEMEIQPGEKHLIWYSTKTRLPDVSPAAGTDPRPPRAHRKFDQSLVAGKKDQDGAEQMIFMPAPEIPAPKPLPLPNVIAMAPAPLRPMRPFRAPEPRRLTGPAGLPEAPRVAAAVPAASLALPTVKAPLREFQAPADPQRQAVPSPDLPDAPRVGAAALPANSLAIAAARAPLRNFNAPSAPARVPSGPAILPDAPGVTAAAVVSAIGPALPAVRAPLKGFNVPEKPLGTASPDLPADTTAVPAGPYTVEASLAIAGLNPVKAPDFVPPPGSRKAGFSAGPNPAPEGGDGGSSGNATIVVPGLLVRGGDPDDHPVLVARAAPTSRENLAAAMHAAVVPGATQPEAIRVTSAPDPRLEGRAVYTMAIQMPNVTSYSGSWIVWFAEHQPNPGSATFVFHAPAPLHKVDPKYIAAAAAERIEGKVRLYAVIRKDGHVESVALLQGIDERLNRSACEALAKWQFTPARHNGTPVDVDAVFEIPFHLAPLPTRK